MHTLLHEFGLKNHQTHCYWRSRQPSRWSTSMLFWDIALLGRGEKMKPDSICESLYFGYTSKLKTAYWPGEADWGCARWRLLYIPKHTTKFSYKYELYQVLYSHLNRCSHSKYEAFGELSELPYGSYCHRCSLFSWALFPNYSDSAHFQRPHPHPCPMHTKSRLIRWNQKVKSSIHLLFPPPLSKTWYHPAWPLRMLPC